MARRDESMPSPFDPRSTGAKLLRDRFIEASEEALSGLDCEAPQRKAYLEGLAICRALESLEDIEIVLAMRSGECKRLNSCASEEDRLRYCWTTEAIGWVAAYLDHGVVFSDRIVSRFRRRAWRHRFGSAPRWQVVKLAGIGLAVAASMAAAMLASVL
jgi:hypothetical protein